MSKSVNKDFEGTPQLKESMVFSRTASGRCVLAVAIGAVTLALAGCPSQQVQTLADLAIVELPEEPEVQLPTLDVSSLQDSYQTALANTTDPAARRLINLRLADLEAERLEQLQADNPGQIVKFDSAIEKYRAVLGETAQAGGSESDLAYLNYQLAKAYAMQGDQERSLDALGQVQQVEKASPFFVETLFRRAEADFNAKNYRAAAQGYWSVLSQGNSVFRTNAEYMFAWSQFKSQNYRPAAQGFVRLLDYLAEGGSFEELESGKQRLVDDSLRVLAMSLNYLGGWEQLEGIAKNGSQRKFHSLLYKTLGDWYLEKERYEDSANTYLAYVNHYPVSEAAPGLHLAAIEVYRRGNFPSKLIPAKKTYVENYGIHSPYWAAATADARSGLQATLHAFLQELAKFEHARAQSLSGAGGKRQGADARIKAGARTAYLAAAGYYEQFAETFPADTLTPEMVFLSAEALQQAGDHGRAYKAYDRVAYEFGKQGAEQRAAEAGYAAILAADRMAASDAAAQASLWQDIKTEASLKFADTFPEDARALAVLIGAADNLFRKNAYEPALQAAGKALDWQPAPRAGQKETLYLIVGHSHFELQSFAEAEAAYSNVLALPNLKATKRADIVERLQVAIYQQAQELLAAGNKQESIAELLRVRQAGNSPTASAAQYDAINLLLELEDWGRVIAEVADFRMRYPKHKLVATLMPKMILAHEGSGDWVAAAGELVRYADSDVDEETRRGARLVAAEHLEKAGEIKRAIALYRDYSHAYPQPMDQQLEVQFKLVNLYEAEGDVYKRNFWLKKLGANKGEGDRAQYLKAYALSDLAAQSYEKFRAIKLTLPLQKSLKDKKRAMEVAVADNRKVMDSGIQAFATRANFEIAEIYQQLSRDLLDSERPGNLSDLELEQYEILLEEQAYPFEESAIELHQVNALRTAEGVYDEWVKRSLASLRELLPVRYNKQEKALEWSDEVY
ncbi:hypothetical protein [Biformimicrobium ophioploci]|uniref:Tetratricopeptide repeat protein n=1 Tax=Biformimicrobium ophioploci TaxID=3036711 RepID=A0ABQ6M1C5_9GAMM|nr:hypothetical protein [Microbulbifer sp. NKW57]GMG88087.1 tetratricopeptide repeat protein [Microbulbifer sp. NKW57]